MGGRQAGDEAGDSVALQTGCCLNMAPAQPAPLSGNSGRPPSFFYCPSLSLFSSLPPFPPPPCLFPSVFACQPRRSAPFLHLPSFSLSISPSARRVTTSLPISAASFSLPLLCEQTDGSWLWRAAEEVQPCVPDQSCTEEPPWVASHATQPLRVLHLARKRVTARSRSALADV